MKTIHRIIAAIKRFYSPAPCECGGELQDYHGSGDLQCDKCGRIV